MIFKIKRKFNLFRLYLELIKRNDELRNLIKRTLPSEEKVFIAGNSFIAKILRFIFIMAGKYGNKNSKYYAFVDNLSQVSNSTYKKIYKILEVINSCIEVTGLISFYFDLWSNNNDIIAQC